MRLRMLFILCSLFLFVQSPAAQQPSKKTSACADALIPTEEQSQSDYRLLQAYVFENAEHEYDRLQIMDESQRNAAASYKAFSAEYHDSHSSQEFREKVRDRLTKESSIRNESDARSYSRRYLSEAQLAAWSRCITDSSKGGAVVLTPQQVKPGGFALNVSWIPPVTIGSGTLKIKVVGGNIEGETSVTEKLAGRGEKPYTVTRARGAGSITVTAEFVGNSDSISVDYATPAAPLAPPGCGFPVGRWIGKWVYVDAANAKGVLPVECVITHGTDGKLTARASGSDVDYPITELADHTLRFGEETRSGTWNVEYCGDILSGFVRRTDDTIFAMVHLNRVKAASQPAGVLGSQPLEPPTEPKPESNWKLYLLLGGLSIFVIAGLIYFVYRRR
jgi:hypothetical protein